MWTLQSAALLFAVAAVGGLMMLVMRLRGAPFPPLWLALGHGAIAACGLTVLGNVYLQSSLTSLANWALLVFLLAAAGGATMFVGFHLRGRALPIPLVIGHGLLGATGLALLLMAILI